MQKAISTLYPLPCPFLPEFPLHTLPNIYKISREKFKIDYTHTQVFELIWYLFYLPIVYWFVCLLQVFPTSLQDAVLQMI